MKKMILLKKGIFAIAFFLILFSGCSVDGVSGNGPNADRSGGLNVLGAPVIQPLPAPEVSASVSGTSVTVSWNAIENSIGYEVVFSGPSNIQGVTPEDGFNGLSVTRDDIAPGNYTVKVRALVSPNDKQYQSSPFSDEMPFIIDPSVIKKTKLAAPVISAIVSYSAPSIQCLTASKRWIWPVNKAMVPVTFSGKVGTGKGVVKISWTDIDDLKAAGYKVTFDGVTVGSSNISGVSAGTHTITVTALAGNSPSYLDSDVVTATVNVLPGSASYTLIDEYPAFYCGKVGRGELKQVVNCSAGPLPFSSPTTVLLQAWRFGQDISGRHYFFKVTVKNGDQSATVRSWVMVVVPHGWFNAWIMHECHDDHEPFFCHDR